MRRIETSIPDICIVEPDIFEDARGFLMESYNAEAFAALGIRDVFVQDTQVHSVRATLRGLHYQLRAPQAKLCRVVTGRVLDVAVDIRSGSPTFGKSTQVELTAENRRTVYIPAGFAHGYVVLSESADFLYKVSAFYAPDDQMGIAWDDADLGIPWKVERPVLSERDRRNPRLRDVPAGALPRFA